ncbi:MAG: acetyl-CoA carboxylase biotin carboxyl carrier protein [Candidatus Sumerlaeia bacterium]|nr:acetyl-CoA carboxylase biotin carboxyl carrier protein [Candidatus Sumerlaeia bacterium]
MGKKTTTKTKEKFNLQDIKELIALLRRNNIWEFDLEQNGTRIRIVTGQSDRAKFGLESRLANGLAQPFSSGSYPSIIPAVPPAIIHSPTTSPQIEKPAEVSSANPAGAPVDTAKSPPQTREEEKLLVIKAPMVGTFYRAPSPDAPPYVEVGDPVKEDTVLCIIEAMKLMNEIKADCRGKVVKILVENGQPVEYGQPIFVIEPETA